MIYVLGALLVPVILAGLWFFFPAILTNLVKDGLFALFQKVKPLVLKRKPPEEEALDHEWARMGQQRPTKLQPHPDERNNH